MDAWCALWFWPLDKVDLLDGSNEIYPKATRAPKPAPEPAPVDPDPNFPTTWVKDSLFGETPRQPTLAEAAPKTQKKLPRPKPAPAPHRSPVPLADLDDWLDFAEALLGRVTMEEGTLAQTWGGLEELGKYEELLENPSYMYMDPEYRLLERFPWLATVHDIAEDQGFFHWELRFASVFTEGGFDPMPRGLGIWASVSVSGFDDAG
jgi:hypothetical protein